jgi:transposase-like protein
MKPLSFKRHRFPPDIIRHAIWLCARFTLSFRDVEELLAERGVDASYETVRRWVLKFGVAIAANIGRTRPQPSDHWHFDEMVISIRGNRYWLWRAVDNEGEVLDNLVQRRRDAKVARKLMTKLLKKCGFAPTRIVTDRLQSYPAAFHAMGSPPTMTVICVRTTGQRIRINRSGDGSENNSGSSHRARPNAFSPSMPLLTTPSPINATYNADRISRNFAPARSARGRRPAPLHSMGPRHGMPRPGRVNVTMPRLQFNPGRPLHWYEEHLPF